MKALQLIEILEKAVVRYGDNEVKLMNPESGDWNEIKSIIKLHPYNAPYGCMNRSEPVNAFAITDVKNNAEDLILN